MVPEPPFLESFVPAPWSYGLLAAGGAAAVLLLLRRRRRPRSEEGAPIHTAVLINTKGQLLRELALDDEADLGYPEVMRLLVGKGILSVETVEAAPFHVHFLHWDDLHLACVSSSPSREAVAPEAEALRDRLLAQVPAPA